IFTQPGCAKLEGIFAHLRTEFCASGDYFCASSDEDAPVESGFAPGLSERLSEKRLTEEDIAALRAATGDFPWGDMAFGPPGKVYARAPTFDEIVEHSTTDELVEFFREYVDDNGRLIETAAEPDDNGRSE